MKGGQTLVEEFRKKEVRALGRLISKAENRDPGLYPLLAELYNAGGKSKVLGITGPPGAGKSSLVNSLVQRLREAKETVAVIAVDPVSPFTGGALLGDRIRLNEHFNDPGVFIRSLSTRGKLGGLSLATREVVHLLDAFGFQNILIETVGVGQSEIDIKNIADATLLVLVPEWGDAIQTLKAGILEIGDLITINKSDREGADRLLTELRTMIEMANRKETPLLLTSQKDPSTLQGLFETIQGFFASHAKQREARRSAARSVTAVDLLEAYVAAEARLWAEAQAEKAGNPYEFLIQFQKKHSSGSLFRA